MLKIFYSKWISFLILIQPLFDVLTSIMIKNGFYLTIGMFVKMIILLLMATYLIFIDKCKRKQNVIFLCIIIVFCIGNVFLNLDIVKIKTLSYFSYLMNFLYLIVSFIFFIRWYENGNRIDLDKFKLPFIIIAVTAILSWITGTYFNSYLAWTGKVGNSSWFSSANEFGSLLAMLFPISIYNSFFNDHSQKYEFIFTIIIGLFLIFLGTKTGFLGYFVSLISYLLYRIITLKEYKFDKKVVIILLLIILPLTFYKQLPAVRNFSQKYKELEIDNKFLSENEKKEKVNYLVYSGRINFIAQSRLNRKNITVLERAFGKFYLRDKKDTNSELLITEQDMFDVYFLFGFLGVLFLFTPLIYIFAKFIKSLLKNKKIYFYNQKIVFLLISIVIEFFVSIMSGHTLLVPLASTFLIIILMNLCYNEIEEKSKKKSILIGSVHLEIGGIERTLISLLKEINYEKYQVSLFLLKPSGEFYNEVPKQVKIITPYKSNFMKKIVISNHKICKIIKHLFFNYFTGPLYVYNKKYDIAISYSGYYSFIDTYISSCNASKKLIWVHTDVNLIYKTEKKYRNKIMRTKHKYQKYDKIVGVSEGVAKSFSEMLPKYKNKTTYMWNLIKKESNNISDVTKLKGKFKIISIGRFSYQKRFDKIIDIANQFKQNNIKIKFYIVGNGAEFKNISCLISKYELENYIILLGAKNNVSDILKQADLFLSTSDYEGFPTVLMEALMCGIPIVATDVCGNSDIYKYVAPKETMILVKNNIDELVKGIIKAQDGKIKKGITFDTKRFNKLVMEKFYEIINN